MSLLIIITASVLFHIPVAEYELILTNKPGCYFNSTLLITGLENAIDSSANTYSIIGTFNKTKRNRYTNSEHEYQFKLVYTYENKSDDVLQWKQTSWLTDTLITGADLFSVPDQTGLANWNKFTGLGLNTGTWSAKFCYLDGNGGTYSAVSNGVGQIIPWSWNGNNGNKGIIGFKNTIAQTSTLYILYPPCTYYNEGPIEIKLNQVIGDIQIKNILEISFDLQINAICDGVCNIFSIKNNNIQPLIIYTLNNIIYTIFQYADWKSRDIFKIYDKYSLITDGNYHHFYYKFSTTDRIISIDDVNVVKDINLSYDHSMVINNSYDMYVSWAQTDGWHKYVHNGNIENLWINSLDKAQPIINYNAFFINKTILLEPNKCFRGISISDEFEISFDLKLDVWQSDTGFIHIWDIQQDKLFLRYNNTQKHLYLGIDSELFYVTSYEISTPQNDGQEFNILIQIRQNNIIVIIDNIVALNTVKTTKTLLIDKEICFSYAFNDHEKNSVKSGTISNFAISEISGFPFVLPSTNNPISLAPNKCFSGVSIPDEFEISFDFKLDVWQTETGFIHIWDIPLNQIFFRYIQEGKHLYFGIGSQRFWVTSQEIGTPQNDGQQFDILAKVTQSHITVIIDNVVALDTVKAMHSLLNDVQICFSSVFNNHQEKSIKPGIILNFAITGITAPSALYPQTDHEIECGQNTTGSLNSALDIDYYYFNLQNESSVLFDSCGSSFKTKIILFDINLNEIQVSDYSDACGFQAQLFVSSLNAGKYVVAINGNGIDTNHDYGTWHIQAICDNQFEYEGIVNCDDSFSGTLMHFPYKFDVDYYLFHVTENNKTIIFDGCKSDYFVWFEIIDSDSQYVEPHEWMECEHEWYMDDKLKYGYQLNVGEYLVEMSTWDKDVMWANRTEPIHDVYNIDIVCIVEDSNIHEIGPYIWTKTQIAGVGPENTVFTLNDEQLYLYQLPFEEAELFCESQYDTSLATITTPTDMYQATIVGINLHYGYDVWVGMYIDIDINGSKWNWIDGTNCNYTKTKECVDDDRWIQIRIIDSLNQTAELSTARSGAAINFKHMWWTGSGIIEHRNDDKNIFFCNAPSSHYKWKYCENTIDCWQHIKSYDDFIVDEFIFDLNNDFYFEFNDNGASEGVFDLNLDLNSYSMDPWNNTFPPPIAFWNSKLFIFGLHEIYYTKFEFFSTEYKWNHIPYKNTHDWSIHNILKSPQRYTQYQSTLHLFDTDSNTLITIDLNSLNITLSVIQRYNFVFVHCIVADMNNVYIIDNRKIARYNVNRKSMVGSRTYANAMSSDFPFTCSISNDYKFIYIFTGVLDRLVYKYVIEEDSSSTLPFSNLCYTVTGKTITAMNGMIYLHGCYVAPFSKNLIYNTKTDKFETEAGGIDRSINSIVYRKSQLTQFDDNILLLLHSNKNSSFSLYYKITDLISINFTKTTTNDVWPSNG
eukprot:432494_1